MIIEFFVMRLINCVDRDWETMGGKIYADIVSGMTHYGNYAFRGNVSTQFKK